MEHRSFQARRPLRRFGGMAGALLLGVAGCSSPSPSSSPSSSPTACVSNPSAWSPTGSLAQARLSPSATLLLDGKVLIAGGDNGARYEATAELYDPASGAWSTTGSMTARRFVHTATLLADGRVLVAGGNGYGSTTPELYDPETGTWAAAGAMVHSRNWHTATKLASGKVLFVGGIGGVGGGASSAHTQPAELYDPVAATWTPTGPMEYNRVGHTATLLADGRVLVAGGTSQSAGPPRTSAEIYDPLTNAWSATGDLLAARAEHVAVRLATGAVLVVGGLPSDGETVPSAELFDPATGRWSLTGTPDLGDPTLATSLCDGTALLVDGASQGAEVYDEASGAFLPTWSPAGIHGSATLVRLADGRVLLVGGVGEAGEPTTSAELFGSYHGPETP